MMLDCVHPGLPPAPARVRPRRLAPCTRMRCSCSWSLAGPMMPAAADPGLHPPEAGYGTWSRVGYHRYGALVLLGTAPVPLRGEPACTLVPWTPGWPGSDGASRIRWMREAPAPRPPRARPRPAPAPATAWRSRSRRRRPGRPAGSDAKRRSGDTRAGSEASGGIVCRSGALSRCSRRAFAAVRPARVRANSIQLQTGPFWSRRGRSMGSASVGSFDQGRLHPRHGAS